MTRLVLTRKTDEAVVITSDGNHIASVKVSKIGRNQVRLVFEADKSVKIDRKELLIDDTMDKATTV